MENKQFQAQFFDNQPSLYPWPNLLVETGFKKTYKPRDVKFKKYLNLLGMKEGEKILEVGCGEGIFLARVARTYEVDCTGVDISKKSIATAKKWEFSRLRFQVADVAQLPFKNEEFNHVISIDALEHIQDQKRALLEMVRVLKPSGLLLLYTINKNQRYTWNFWLDKMGIDVYKRVAHDPPLFLEPLWIKKELRKRGMRIKRLELYDSFFLLACEEVIMLFVLGLKKLNFFNPSSPVKTRLGKIFFNLTDWFSRFLLISLGILEIPWKKLGYSNSFFVLGRKNPF